MLNARQKALLDAVPWGEVERLPRNPFGSSWEPKQGSYRGVEGRSLFYLSVRDMLPADARHEKVDGKFAAMVWHEVSDSEIREITEAACGQPFRFTDPGVRNIRDYMDALYMRANRKEARNGQ